MSEDILEVLCPNCVDVKGSEIDVEVLYHRGAYRGTKPRSGVNELGPELGGGDSLHRSKR